MVHEGCDSRRSAPYTYTSKHWIRIASSLLGTSLEPSIVYLFHFSKSSIMIGEETRKQNQLLLKETLKMNNENQNIEWKESW